MFTMKMDNYFRQKLLEGSRNHSCLCTTRASKSVNKSFHICSILVLITVPVSHLWKLSSNFVTSGRIQPQHTNEERLVQNGSRGGQH